MLDFIPLPLDDEINTYSNSNLNSPLRWKWSLGIRYVSKYIEALLTQSGGLFYCDMMKLKLSNSGIGAALGILGIVMFSAKAVMVKLGYRYEVDAVPLLFLRRLFALPVYLVIAYRETKNSSKRLSSKELIQVIALGFVGYYMASYFDFFGLQFSHY